MNQQNGLFFQSRAMNFVRSGYTSSVSSQDSMADDFNDLMKFEYD